jgi:hypothetical protein
LLDYNSLSLKKTDKKAIKQSILKTYHSPSRLDLARGSLLSRPMSNGQSSRTNNIGNLLITLDSTFDVKFMSMTMSPKKIKTEENWSEDKAVQQLRSKELQLLTDINILNKRKEELYIALSEYDVVECLRYEISSYRAVSANCAKTARQLNEQILALKTQLDKFNVSKITTKR